MEEHQYLEKPFSPAVNSWNIFRVVWGHFCCSPRFFVVGINARMAVRRIAKSYLGSADEDGDRNIY
jgi:hypothetical protein